MAAGKGGRFLALLVDQQLGGPVDGGSRGDFLPSVPYCGANRYGFPLLATAAPAVGFDIETLRGFRVCDGIPGGTLAGFGAGSLAEYATLAPMVRRFGRTDLLLRPRLAECYRPLAKLRHPRKGSSLPRRHREVTVGQGHMEADILAARQ